MDPAREPHDAGLAYHADVGGIEVGGVMERTTDRVVNRSAKWSSLEWCIAIMSCTGCMRAIR